MINRRMKMPGIDFYFGEVIFMYQLNDLYFKKFITNQKWLFIDYKLCDVTANIKQTLLCKTMYQCGALIIRSKPRKILISFEPF